MSEALQLEPEDWQWWDVEKKDELAHIVTTVFKDLIDQTARDRRERLAAMRSMYLDIADERFADESFAFSREMRSPYNLLQGAVDSTLAHIVTQRPRPMLLSVGGNGPLRRMARMRQRWMDGEYHRLNVYKMTRQMVLDSLLFGSGLIKITEHNRRNKLERVWAGDLWTDPREERFECVRTLYQLYAIDRGVLIKKYKDHEKDIRGVTETVIDDVPFPDLRVHGYSSPNLINVIEAWRLPIDENTPGRRVLLIDTAVLEDEPWDDPDFPFLHYRWAPVPQSWWGQGMVERGAGMQSDLNELCDIIGETGEAFVPQLWAEEGSTDLESLDNTVGKVNKFKGGPEKIPKMISPAINPVILEQEDRRANRFYSVLGVNQMHAGAVKPAGVESGKGLQTLNDTTTTRLVPNEQQYEEVVAVDLPTKLTRNARRIAAKHGEKGKQRVFGGQYMRGGLQAVDFPSTIPKDMEEDEVFFIRPFPVAQLSNSVAQRYDDIERMEQNGAFPDLRYKRELMQVPDIDGYVDRDLAGSDLIELAIEKALDGEDVAAETYWPAIEASTRIGQAIQLAQLNDEKPENIQRLRNLHQSLLQLPVGVHGLTVPPNDPSLAPTMPVTNPSPAAPVGVPAMPPMPGGPMPPGPQGPMQ